MYAWAALYRKTGAGHLAIKDYDRVLEHEPGSPRAQVQKGYHYLVPLLPVILVLLLG